MVVAVVVVERDGERVPKFLSGLWSAYKIASVSAR